MRFYRAIDGMLREAGIVTRMQKLFRDWHVRNEFKKRLIAQREASERAAGLWQRVYRGYKCR